LVFEFGARFFARSRRGAGGDMPDLTQVLSSLTLAIVAVATFAVTLTKKGLETAVAKSAENAIARYNWSNELERALQKTRGEQRQELRFKCYAALWAQLRPLALYAEKAFARSDAVALSAKLSDWYFSDTGGLLLTREARPFYFALQDLLRAVGTTASDWQAVRTSDDQGPRLRAVLERLNLPGALRTLAYLDEARFENWPDVAEDLGNAWKSDMSDIAREQTWLALDASERFAVLQQAGSLLRSSLTADIESRIR
jgi:hypothetical protein